MGHAERIAYEDIATINREDSKYRPEQELKQELRAIRNAVRLLKDKMSISYADSDASISDIDLDDAVQREFQNEEEKYTCLDGNDNDDDD